jgi:starch-binding outer membrane protein, SusD/RagB family
METLTMKKRTLAGEANMERRNPAGARVLRRLGGYAAVLVAAAGLAGCDALDRALSVEAPGLVKAEDMTRPENASVLVTGLISDFDCALGAYIANSGLLGNELMDASVTAARFPLDSRNIDDTSPYGVNACNGNPPGIYVPLSTAIWTSNNALTLLKGWTDAEVAFRTGLIAQAAAYSGYSHVLMGEGFCSSVITEKGPEVTPAQIFAVAEQRFTEAITAADAALAGTPTAAQQTTMRDTRNMALLGRARVRLNLGNAPGAAADARALLAASPTYVKNATASDAAAIPRRWNRMAEEFRGGNSTVAPAYRGLTVEGVPDTRVDATNTNTNGHDGATRVWTVSKYGLTRLLSNRAIPYPIATWREAHLIIAEAEGGAEAVTRVNLLRAHHGLPAYTGGTSEAEIRALIIQERARELYLEGHHLNDLRRFNLPNVPAAGEPYRQGGSYGSVRCFPVPAVEKNNNPNF